jgi:hypothetical protein
VYRFFPLVFALALLCSCALPSIEGERSDARSTLMKYWAAWGAGDFQALYDLSCQEDQERLSSASKELRTLSKEAESLGFVHNLKSVDEKGILTQLLGPAPKSLEIGLSTQIALNRTALGKRGSLGAWTLSIQEGDFFVCLGKPARLILKALETELQSLAMKITQEKKARKVLVE